MDYAATGSSHDLEGGDPEDGDRAKNLVSRS